MPLLDVGQFEVYLLAPDRGWLDPRSLVPIFGMIVGKMMKGAARAAVRLPSDMEVRRGDEEACVVARGRA